MDWADFECWLEAGLGEGAWSSTLDMLRGRLNARAVALGLAPRPGVAGEVFANDSADAAFVGFCHEHLDRYAAAEVQTATHENGLIAWAHAASDQRSLVQDVALFVAWDRLGDCERLSQFVHTVARMVAARRERAAMRATLALCGATFDRLPFGVVVVDEALYASEPNTVCREVFARADGLLHHQGRLTCRFDADRAQLSAAIAATIAGKPSQAAVLVGRARGAEPYAVFPVHTSVSVGQTQRCLVAVVDPDHPGLGRGKLATTPVDLDNYQYLLAKALI